MKPKHNHPLYIIKQMIQLIRQMLFPILIIFFTNIKDKEAVFIIPGFFILIGVLLFFAFLAWQNTCYYVERGVLFYEKGIFNKSKQGINLEKITTINENQELIERLFRLTTFKVDAGSATKGNEIKLTISREEADWLKALLSLEMAGPDPQNDPELNHGTGTALTDRNPNPGFQAAVQPEKKTYRIQVKELILYAVTSNSFFAGFAFALALWQFGQEFPGVERLLNGPMAAGINQYFDDNIKGLSLATMIGLAIGVLFIYLFFSFVISIILAVVKYYDFTVSRWGDRIDITYGLLDRKNFNLSVDKITALYLNYGLIGQFFKMGALKVESIGYGDEKGEAAILYPIVKSSRCGEILRQLLPEYALISEPSCRPPKRALKSFLVKFMALPTAVAAVLSFAQAYGRLAWILVPVMGATGWLLYRKTGISRQGNQFVLQGGILGRSVTVIKTHHIQTMTTKQSAFQKRAGLVHLEYTFQSNNPGKRVGVQFVDEIEAAEFTRF